MSAAEIGVLYAETQPAAKAWHFRYYGNAAPAEPDWRTDADGNGLSRLQEYAWGGVPFQPVQAGFDPALAWTNGTLNYSYNRRAAGTSELVYQAEYTLDLLTWLDLSSPVLAGPHPTIAGFERARQSVPLTNTALSLRLRTRLP